ncbi:hypothetical protein MLD38_006378 [Melastoma candidum]|uniref:Uncharacterized protein n=1 Tax=Melastoma candidum TaxID=119954 RepID=A0ACB9RMB5_9MYRT|nr:hypothetical protein MLD38_006378 [Melastoma candidum]
MVRIALGSIREATQPDCIRALVVEFIVTFLFVFIGVGTAMASDKLDAGSTMAGLFAVAMAHGLVVAVMISGGHISGGHLNPAVTLGLMAGGHITVFRSAFYWVDQLLAASSACFLLVYLTGGETTPIISLASDVGYLQGVIWEVVLTFTLLFSVYATIVDPKKGALNGLGPTLVGFVVAANILAGGAYSGAAINPARAFGPAIASWDWTDHWVYWVGPLTGGGLAGYIYENFFIEGAHVPLLAAEDTF